MNISRLVLASLIALAPIAAASGAFASATPSASAMPHASPPSAFYHCAWNARFNKGVGWTGDLTIRINPEGIINGTYRSTSIKPDPFYGRIITVTGGLTGKNIRLSFGGVPSVTVRGDYEGKKITGTAVVQTKSYDFVAVSPHT